MTCPREAKSNIACLTLFSQWHNPGLPCSQEQGLLTIENSIWDNIEVISDIIMF